jgi:type II secretion system protein J
MNRRAFTLIELVLAMAGCALILTAIYGVFSRGIHLRDHAMARTRDSRVKARALSVLRNDLRNARVSGGTLAISLTGSVSGQSSNFPGYLKFTTTTATDDLDLPSGDLQQVEYYVTTDPEAQGGRAGLLVRTVDKDLLAPVQTTPPEEPLLAGVQSMEITFFDGTDWQSSWEVTEDDTTLPEAVRVRLQMAPETDGGPLPPPLEVLVPWTTQVATEAATTTAQ